MRSSTKSGEHCHAKPGERRRQVFVPKRDERAIRRWVKGQWPRIKKTELSPHISNKQLDFTNKFRDDLDGICPGLISLVSGGIASQVGWQFFWEHFLLADAVCIVISGVLLPSDEVRSRLAAEIAGEKRLIDDYLQKQKEAV